MERMDIGKIDTFLASTFVKKEDAEWHSVMEKPFSVHGVLFDENEDCFVRMPIDVARATSDAVYNLSKMTSGGRVRFKTDSPYVALYCRAPSTKNMPHMSILGSHGVSLYQNGKYAGKIMPTVDEMENPHEEGILFGGVVSLKGKGTSEIELYMPLYGGVSELHVGVESGSFIGAARNYTYKAPIVMYGSSITQGACASRPGNDYVMRLSRLLDAEVLNLGFSGSGNAEPAMLEYLANLEASAFVFDYNYYTSRPERRLPPHFEVYQTLRAKNPKTPILMIDKPGVPFAGENYPIRSKMIRESYERAVALGDGLVDMMDASEFFGTADPEECLVDTDHPNDLGFYRMAEAMYPKLLRLLKLAAKE